MATETKKKEVYLVEGMTCAGCERTVANVIKNLGGVRSAVADLKSSTVSVEYDAEKTTLDQIRAVVNAVGYNFVGETSIDDEDVERGDDPNV
jgi:copper chaperone CopZ